MEVWYYLIMVKERTNNTTASYPFTLDIELPALGLLTITGMATAYCSNTIDNGYWLLSYDETTVESIINSNDENVEVTDSLEYEIVDKFGEAILSEVFN